MSKTLQEIAKACGIGRERFAEHASTEVTGISYDSRSVEPGFAFFAISGQHSDGHNFIPQAIERGASVVFCQELPDPPPASKVPKTHPLLLQVRNTRVALSQASAAFYDHPENELVIIGVTGTDGKSSTVSFLHQLLEAHSIPSGYISTVSIHSGEQKTKNTLRQSTPEAPIIFRLLREMVSSGKVVAIIEATSHGLSDKTARLYSIRYDGAIFTNISQDHLEFHGSFVNYLSSKANIFRRLRERPPALLGDFLAQITEKVSESESTEGIMPVFLREILKYKGPWACINRRSKYFELMKTTAEEQHATVCPFYIDSMEESKKSGILVNMSAPNDTSTIEFSAYKLNSDLAQTSFTMRVSGVANEDNWVTELPVALPTPGAFNVENALAALSMVHNLFGIPLHALAKSMQGLKPVTGRMTQVSEGQNFSVIVDYAHTPGSFKRLLPLLRKFCNGRLILVFGSAGERDKPKRPLQGAIASEFADIIILSEEDSRSEDPLAIIKEIEQGVQAKNPICTVYKIPDRSQAISKAIQLAQDNDLIALLGKGHEENIFRAEGSIPWNEEQVVRRAIRSRFPS